MIGLLMLAAVQPQVVITVTSNEPCQYTVDGEPASAGDLQAVLNRHRRKTTRALIRYKPETIWACMGEAMTYVARAHFKKMEFDPPLPKPTKGGSRG